MLVGIFPMSSLSDRWRHWSNRHVEGVAELHALGWIDAHRPRMVVVQAEGCAPIVKAFEEGATEPRCGRMPTPQRLAYACERPSPTF